MKRQDGSNANVVLEQAESVLDAMKMAELYWNGSEVYAVYLSPYIEAYHAEQADEQDCKWYDVTLSSFVETEKGVKKTNNHMLVQAKTFDECYARMETIAPQGYDMTLKSIKEARVDGVYDFITPDLEMSAEVINSTEND